MFSAMWAALSALAAMIAIPTLAFAAPPHPSHSADFSLRADGFRVGVTGLASGEDGARVFVSISRSLGKERFGFTQASYSVEGHVSGKRVRADLGPFGLVDVRFHPRGRVHKQRIPGCKGTLFTSQSGRFAGRIQFHGESGYVEVDAKRARGRVGTQGNYECPTGHAGPPPFHEGKKVEQITLSATTKDRELSFSATERPGDPPSPFSSDGPAVEYAATEVEPCGRVSISRYISVEGSSSSFVFDHALTSASVAPPPPFFGSAAFSRDPATGVASWEGTLGASFLGLDQSLIVSPLNPRLERDRVDPTFAIVHAYRYTCDGNG